MSRWSARGSAWNKIRQTILERDGGVCVHCNGIATTVDHLVPRSIILKQGGSAEIADAPSNLVASCDSCNKRRGDKLIVHQPYFNSRYFK